MSISGVGAASAAAASAGAAAQSNATKKSDFDTFLALLTAQLKNQDPSDPTDSTALVAQLATFSSVEQQIKTNQKLDTLLSAIAASDQTSMLGKWISSPDESVSGKVMAIRILAGSAVAVLESGKTVDLSGGYTLRETAPAPGNAG